MTVVSSEFPILEYDPDRKAVLEPQAVCEDGGSGPECWVICFFREIVERVAKTHNAKPLAHWDWEDRVYVPYAIEYQGREIGILHSGVGAPISVGLLEDLIHMGGRKFVACGGAGVLVGDICSGHVVIPDVAIRDEGTSYHYLPPSREVAASPSAVRAIEETMRMYGVPYLKGKTWTTDAPYRETQGMVARRRGEGCLTVEMEASAFFAVAQFRGVEMGQILYGGDDVSGAEWDARNWKSRESVRENLFWLAAEACLAI
jgi:uridine phosphorylase